MEHIFEKITTFQYSSEAVIVKGRLEAEGIEVFMADNFTIDADPLVSNAIGGVKLFVKAEDIKKAKAILSEISRYSVDDSGKNIVCPKCGTAKVDVGSTIKDVKSFFAFIFGFGLLGTIPFYTKYTYRCDNCGNEFKIK